jgi:magnesium transporter
MIKFFKNVGDYLEVPKAEKGYWVNVVQPTPEEIEILQSEFKIPADIISDVLDVDERPRYEYEDDWSLVILRIPVVNTNNGVPFQTIPLGIFYSDDYTVTLCSSQNDVLPAGQPTLYRESYQQVSDVLNFIFKLFLRSGSTYLRYLKQINQQTNMIEQDLEKSIRNQELNKLLKMEKCLVFFITSLKANEIVLTRLRNSKKNSLSDLNEDLLEDALIENKQALEMSQIYSDIQSGMMDAFASVISNNLNGVMKQLTTISIVLMIPTLIASIYGMNVPNFLEDAKWAFPMVIIFSGFISLMTVLLFRKKDWF